MSMEIYLLRTLPRLRNQSLRSIARRAKVQCLPCSDFILGDSQFTSCMNHPLKPDIIMPEEVEGRNLRFYNLKTKEYSPVEYSIGSNLIIYLEIPVTPTRSLEILAEGYTFFNGIYKKQQIFASTSSIVSEIAGMGDMIGFGIVYSKPNIYFINRSGQLMYANIKYYIEKIENLTNDEDKPIIEKQVIDESQILCSDYSVVGVIAHNIKNSGDRVSYLGNKGTLVTIDPPSEQILSTPAIDDQEAQSSFVFTHLVSKSSLTLACLHNSKLKFNILILLNNSTLKEKHRITLESGVSHVRDIGIKNNRGVFSIVLSYRSDACQVVFSDGKKLQALPILKIPDYCKEVNKILERRGQATMPTNQISNHFFSVCMLPKDHVYIAAHKNTAFYLRIKY